MLERKKSFSCPVCGNRFPLRKVIIMKRQVKCHSCQAISNVRHAIPFYAVGFIGYISFQIPFQYFVNKGWEFWGSAGIGILVGFITLIFICIATYLWTSFEEL